MADNVTFGKSGFLCGPSNIRWSDSYEIMVEPMQAGAPAIVPLGAGSKFMIISGSIEHSRISALTDEAGRRDFIRFESSLITSKHSSGIVYVTVPYFQQTRGPGPTPAYGTFEMVCAVKASSTTHKRCTAFSHKIFANTFDKTGTVAVPLPVGAGNCSETIDANRVASDGTIPVVISPSQPIISYDVTDASLALGNVKVTRTYGQPTQTMISDGLIRFNSQQAQGSNKGRILLEAFNGTSWLTFGTVGVALKTSSQALEYFDDVVPVVEPYEWTDASPERDQLRFGWPSSTTRTYKAFAHLRVLRGRSYGFLELRNQGATVSEARVKINVSRTDLRYYVRAGSTLDAQAGAYGEDLQAGDADTNNFIYLMDTAADGATSLQTGFIREKKADCDYRANDAGDYWNSITITFDNLSVPRGHRVPLVWIFAQKQGNTGSAPSALGDEALVDPFAKQGLAEVV